MSMMQALLFEPVPVLVTTVQGSLLDANGITTVSVPDHEPGDLILAWGSNRTSTPSPTPAGYTSIVTYICNPSFTTSDRSGRAVYKISDGAAHTITFDGGANGASGDAYSGCYIFRNAIGVGASAGVTTTSTGTTFNAPALSLVQAPSTVVVFTLADNMTAAPANWIRPTTGAYDEYLTAWAGGAFTLSATTALIGCSIEIY